MKTITFAIQKGGTGKTSVSVSVAGDLALAGKKTHALQNAHIFILTASLIRQRNMSKT